MTRRRDALPALFLFLAAVPAVWSQTAPAQPGFKQREMPGVKPGSFQVDGGTHILLNMINSVSTRQALIGDRLYLETAFPVVLDGQIIIPQGSWVAGTITQVKRPGRIKGKGQLQVQFDSLTLPNGVSRNLRSGLGAIDSRTGQTMNREKGNVEGRGSKRDDVGAVTRSTVDGTVIGSGVGAAAGNFGRGAGIGVGAGAAAGLVGVLMTRGPDATLDKGSTVEMVLDHSLTFQASELDFRSAPAHAALSQGGPVAPQSNGAQGRRFPF